MQVEELLTKAEFREAFPVMQELRAHLDLHTFMDLVSEALAEGYQLFALRDEHDEIVALAGVVVSTNLAYGRHLYVRDLVTTSYARSQGYGERLLAYLEDHARSEECDSVWLDSGFQRTEAHRFYEQKVGYSKTGYTFRKVIQEDRG